MYQKGDKQMRLIDADNLKPTKGMFIYQTEDADVIATEAYRWELIEREAPTVKAIPIEWIKNYASHKASKDLIDCYWHFWEDDVLKMVSDWEKENANR